MDNKIKDLDLKVDALIKNNINRVNNIMKESTAYQEIINNLTKQNEKLRNENKELYNLLLRIEKLIS